MKYLAKMRANISKLLPDGTLESGDKMQFFNTKEEAIVGLMNWYQDYYENFSSDLPFSVDLKTLEATKELTNNNFYEQNIDNGIRLEIEEFKHNPCGQNYMWRKSLLEEAYIYEVRFVIEEYISNHEDGEDIAIALKNKNIDIRDIADCVIDSQYLNQARWDVVIENLNYELDFE